MAAASIEGINIKIGADLSDLKEEMGATSDAIKGVGTTAKDEIEKANTPVSKLKDNFAKTAISAEKIAEYSLRFVNAVGGFTGDAISKAFELSPDASAAWKNVKSAFDNFKTAFGKGFLPELEKVMPIVSDTLNDAAKFLRKHPGLSESLAALTATLLLIGSVLAICAPIAIAFGVSVGTIAAPVLIVIGVIILLVAAGLYLKTHWGEITEWFKTKSEELKTKIEELKTKIGEWKDSMVEKFSLMKTSVNGKIDEMKTKMDEWKTKVNLAKVQLGTFKDSVVSKFESIKTAITDALKGLDLIQAGKDFVSAIGEGIKAGIESIRSTVQGWFMSLVPDWAKRFFGIGEGGGSSGGGATVGNPTDVFRASGGPVIAGAPYIIGEAGPELFVPRTNGYIIPNDQIRDFGPRVTVNMGNVYGESYLRGMVVDTFEEVVRKEMRIA